MVSIDHFFVNQKSFSLCDGTGFTVHLDHGTIVKKEIIYMKLNMLQSEVNYLIEPIKRLFNVKFFAFTRCFTDGRCHILASNPALYEYCFKQQFKLTSDVPEDMISNDFLYFFSSTQHDPRYGQAIDGFLQTFKIDSFLDCIKVTPGYYDMMCYGADSTNHSAAIQYLNRIDLIKQFNQEFLSKTESLLTKTNTFKLPKCMQNQALQDYTLNTQHLVKLYSDDKIHSIYLTHAQYRCAVKIASGLVAKQIGDDLNLSSRTIEFHTNQLKFKFGVKKKSELIALLNRVL